MKRVLIIDGMNNFTRSYVVDPTLDSNGNPLGGASGFLKILQKNIREIRPDKIIICWEGPNGSQKRRALNKNYKAGRKPSKEQASLNFMAAVTICSDFGAQENKVCHRFHCFPIYLKRWDRMP